MKRFIKRIVILIAILVSVFCVAIDRVGFATPAVGIAAPQAAVR